MAKVTVLRPQRRRQPLSHDWTEAREQIDAELDGFSRAVDRIVFVIKMASAVVLSVLTGALAAFFMLIGAQVDRLLAVAPMTTQERVAQIADVMGDIPATPTLRLQSGPYRGAPTVRALQARLPDVRGITSRERNAACDQVPGLCAP